MRLNSRGRLRLPREKGIAIAANVLPEKAAEGTVAGKPATVMKVEGAATTKKSGTRDEAMAEPAPGAAQPVSTSVLEGAVRRWVPVTVAENAEAQVSGADVPVGIAGAMTKAGKTAAPGAAFKGATREAKRADVVSASGAKQEVGDAKSFGNSQVSLDVSAVKEGAAPVTSQGGPGIVSVAPMVINQGHPGMAVNGAASSQSAGETVAHRTGSAIAARSDDLKTLAGAPNILEVGIDSGTHGWLRVRAELGQTGEVMASVVAGSAGQAETLRREVPAMSSYLAGESVGVSSLVVNAMEQGAREVQDAAMSYGTGGGREHREQGTAAQDMAGGRTRKNL